jgi:hypothetical protein
VGYPGSFSMDCQKAEPSAGSYSSFMVELLWLVGNYWR